ncbi:MAG: putative chromosome-partitioning protein ParB [Alphaproteobacteria bacterium MarineAlpha5_Bin11]|nr:hypothetical protein [Pelagibacteraceae bacterium]PPR44894.1 MAG: putative chromosome-partitioning protein ParB [Alphaproteobacteria bacterium MarineAlpha5_Bin11]PPR51850.1 MAG: putative chromosome-partitioning protein ParB [Alphaproteobacteria bacterium MarineAlpha5_Bin10]|tara:strand:+ start:3465 stop:4340 length:876 start_codon:yes stop_codon:yes gene_type:complete
MSDEKNKKLGKGLSSLLSGKSFTRMQKGSFIDSVNTELKIGITKIIPNTNQPRKKFDKEELQNLSVSIREKGVVQPIIVRKDKNSDNYEIIAGERRWRAAQAAGLDEIPAIIKNMSDTEVFEVALIENIQRENLNPADEAKAYSYLLKQHKNNYESLSKILGKSRSHISNMVRLLELPQDVIELLSSGELTIGHARPLIGLQDASSLAKEIIAKKLSVRQVEKIASSYKPKLKRVNKKLADPNIKELEEELSKKIGLKTSISFSDKSTSGSITVYYSNLDQLDDIMKRLKS